MGKIYAVRNGRSCGLFYSWPECQKQIKGFSNAEYKSFQTLDEASAYLSRKDIVEEKQDENTLCAYVDGSFDIKTGRYGCGVVLLYKGEIKTLSKAGNDPTLASMRNVAGEITASEMAMHHALENGLEKIIIYHDYAGIAKWCTGDWKAEKEGTKRYKQYYDSIKDRLAVRFVKVAAHTGDTYNEMADRLAKDALGIK